MTPSISLWLALIGVASSAAAIPRTPFIGVRISWLMAARNSDLARLAASASSLASLRAFASSRSLLLSSATSRETSSIDWLSWIRSSSCSA